MRVNRFADVHCIGAHLDRQGDFTNHVTGVGADDATAQDLAVAVGFGAIVKQQFGNTFVAAIGDGAARGCPGKRPFLTLMPCALA